MDVRRFYLYLGPSELRVSEHYNDSTMRASDSSTYSQLPASA